MTKKNFFYVRKANVAKKDENGNLIPILDENQKQTGKFETEEKDMVDSFAIDRVLRTHMISEEHVIVLLDDGHEETQKQPALKNPNKSANDPNNRIEERTRVWVQSEISVKGKEQIEALYYELGQGA